MERHQHVQRLLTDYVLGELPPAERQMVHAHLAGCAQCSAEVRELSLAFQSIGLSEEPMAPPPHLRARVLERIEREAAPRLSGTDGVRLAPSRTIARSWLPLAAALVLVAGALLVLSTQRTAQLEERLREANAARSEAMRQLAERSAQADLAVSILTASDMKRIDMAGKDTSRTAAARAYWSATHGLLIVADRLPAPPPGRVYQVWVIGSASAGPVSAGLIDTPGQRGMLIVPAPRGVAGSVTVAISDEPAGGLPAPSGSIHLVGS